MTKGQYLPVELNQTRLVSTARFLIKLIGQLLKTKNAWLMTVTTKSIKTVHMAKFKPRKNQSQYLDLLQDYFAML